MASKLAEVFTSTIEEIESNISGKVKEEEKRISEDYFKKVPKMEGKKKAIEENNKKIDKLQEENRQLNNDIEGADPKLTYLEAQALFNKLTKGKVVYQYSQWNSYKTSSVHIEAKLRMSVPFSNKEARKTIYQQVRQQFNLCIKDVQKQGVILSLQNSIKWSELGISIPNLFDPKKVSISNGKLIITRALPNLKK